MISQLALQHRICRDISGCLTSNLNSTRIGSEFANNVFAAVEETFYLCNEVSRIWVVMDLTTTFLKNSQINQSLHCSNLNYNLSTDPPTQNMHRHFWVQLTSNSNNTRIRSRSLQNMSLQQLQRHSVCAMKFQGSGL